nr:hypothetical protein [uncultured Flavobacterium sp.]
MTKEEKIKEAWGDLYKKYEKFIDSDGGLFWVYLYDSDKININLDLLGNVTYRPKSLQGIEDNNGWISLLGESNEIEWVKNLELYNIKTKEHYFCTDENEFIEIGRFTHYKPIVKSKPPIY